MWIAVPWPARTAPTTSWLSSPPGHRPAGGDRDGSVGGRGVWPGYAVTRQTLRALRATVSQFTVTVTDIEATWYGTCDPVLRATARIDQVPVDGGVQLAPAVV